MSLVHPTAPHPTRSRAQRTAAVAAILLALGAAGCQGSPGASSATGTPSSPSPATTEGSATATSAATPSATTGPLTPPSPTASEQATTAPLTAAPTARPTTLEGTWEAAVAAMLADDKQAFLALSTQDVLDDLTTEKMGAEVRWRDWDVMGGHYESADDQEEPEIVAGACTEGLEQNYDPASMKGDPGFTCRLEFLHKDHPEWDSTMGLFYLHENQDGTFTITDYLRQYQ